MATTSKRAVKKGERGTGYRFGPSRASAASLHRLVAGRPPGSLSE